MKKLWVRLSLAFSGVLILSQLVSFLTLVGLAYFSPAVFVDDFEYVPFTYKEAIGIWVTDQIFGGATSDEIERTFHQEKDSFEIASLIAETEAKIDALANSEPNFTLFANDSDSSNAPAAETIQVDALEPDAFEAGTVIVSAGAAPVNVYTSPLSFPLALFFNSSTIRVIIQSIVIGVIAGVLTSRYLVKPLGQLIEAVQAFGKRDLSRRVQVKGSQEIEELMHTFNNMANKLENAEQLRMNIFSDVSHELRTPLTGLEGSLRASLDKVYEIDDRHIANMVVQTQHLIHLVEDLRLLAQAEARKLQLEPETVNVNQLVQDTVEMFKIQAEERTITLEATLSLPPLTVQADANRIRQILHNLISNSLRYTPENGRIQIIVEQHNNQVQISVEDNGEGIAAEHLPHVFDRFYRTDKARSRDKGGTGLGLAITKALVEAHGGAVDVSSEGIGFGSTFRFWLPL